MGDGQRQVPDSTGVRVALWRAMHVRIDAPPHVIQDEVGLRLAAPDEGWQQRPDMDPRGSSGFRAAIVGRARFIEDLVAEESARGVGQYVVLGAGLDTFAQRRPDIAARLRMFEVDRADTQEWKRRRLIELGLGIPDWLRLVPVDFEAGEDWWERLTGAGFDPGQPTLVACTGVSMYLTKDANEAALRRVAELAPGSTFAMSFLLTPAFIAPSDRSAVEAFRPLTQAEGTPFRSAYSPPEMLALANGIGFAQARHVPGTAIAARYFAGRTDGLYPSTGEDLLVATT